MKLTNLLLCVLLLLLLFVGCDTESDAGAGAVSNASEEAVPQLVPDEQIVSPIESFVETQ